MTRATAILLALLLLAACGGAGGEAATDAVSATSAPEATASTGSAPAQTTSDKTVAEKAFDAGMRARQKAEQIKAGEAQRAEDVDGAAEQ